MEAYAALGVGRVWLSAPPESTDPVGWVDRVGAEVLPRVATI